MDYRNREWKQSMRLVFDYNNMMQEAIGENGLTKEDLLALSLEAAAKGKKDSARAARQARLCRKEG